MRTDLVMQFPFVGTTVGMLVGKSVVIGGPVVVVVVVEGAVMVILNSVVNEVMSGTITVGCAPQP